MGRPMATNLARAVTPFSPPDQKSLAFVPHHVSNAAISADANL